MKSKKILFRLLSLISYFFTALVILLLFLMTNALGLSVIAFLELLIIVFIVNSLFQINRVIANITKFILLLLLNSQLFVYLFSGTFISLIMVTNLASLEALSGKAGIYIPAILGVLIFSVIPTRELRLRLKLNYLSLSVLVALNLILLNITHFGYSPTYNLLYLSKDIYAKYETTQRINQLSESKSSFHNENIPNAITKSENLTQEPNIILLFAEGLSQNIIDDSRQIMPNIATFQKESISFDNYFNHTFATYRGLQGQLYSGYKLGDQDPNYLISVQDILKNQGYYTTFINSEPKNKTFTRYLEDFEFENLVTSNKLNGTANTISDKDLYQLLWKEIEKQSQRNTPFFIATYSFGTHISSDSPDEQFADGKDPLLNRFYNLDVQFGDFIEKFKASSVSDNTIIVFTTDHASFIDSDFRRTFPDYVRNHGMVDEIPFYIYYKGMDSKVIDAQGRNSLSLAPTILDYLDISDENYFLGDTLFSDSESIFNTTFVSENTILSTNKLTDGSHLAKLESNQVDEIKEKLELYYASKLHKPKD